MPIGKLPPLVQLRAFAYVGETGSVRGAAEVMRVDHSVISRHVRSLEEFLGVKLIRSKGRGLALTSEGEHYFDRIARAFEEIADATAALPKSPVRRLEIYSTAGLAHRVLLPAIPSLQALLPAWSIILHTSSEAPPQTGDGVSVEVYFANEPRTTPGTASECTVRPRLFPVVNPRTSASWLTANSPADLLTMPIIHADPRKLWPAWFHNVGVKYIKQLHGPRLQNMHLALEAARCGQGVALANEVLVQEDILSGELIELFDSDIRLEGYHLTGPASGWDTEPVSILRTWLRDLLGRRSVPRNVRTSGTEIPHC